MIFNGFFYYLLIDVVPYVNSIMTEQVVRHVAVCGNHACGVFQSDLFLKLKYCTVEIMNASLVCDSAMPYFSLTSWRGRQKKTNSALLTDDWKTAEIVTLLLIFWYMKTWIEMWNKEHVNCNGNTEAPPSWSKVEHHIRNLETWPHNDRPSGPPHQSGPFQSPPLCQAE